MPQTGIGFDFVVRPRVPSGLPWAPRPHGGARLLPLSGALTDQQVGAVLATLGQALGLPPETDVTAALSVLIETTRRAQPALRLVGGVRLHVGGTVLNPGRGCSVSVSHWRSWCDPAAEPTPAPVAGDRRGPWRGHLPCVVERADGGALRISSGRDGVVVDLSQAHPSRAPRCRDPRFRTET